MGKRIFQGLVFTLMVLASYFFGGMWFTEEIWATTGRLMIGNPFENPIIGFIICIVVAILLAISYFFPTKIFLYSMGFITLTASFFYGGVNFTGNMDFSIDILCAFDIYRHPIIGLMISIFIAVIMIIGHYCGATKNKKKEVQAQTQTQSQTQAQTQDETQSQSQDQDQDQDQ